MNHERLQIRTSAVACGITELYSLSSDVDGMLYQIANHLYHPSRGAPSGMAIWSDTVTVTDKGAHGGTPGCKLADAFRTHGFGRVIESFVTENPRTGNFFVHFACSVQHEPFKKWYAKERARRIMKVGAVT